MSIPDVLWVVAFTVVVAIAIKLIAAPLKK